MPKKTAATRNRKQKSRSFFTKILQRGDSNREFLVLLAIIFMGGLAIMGYAGTGGFSNLGSFTTNSSSSKNENTSALAGDRSNETLIGSMGLAKGVNWSPFQKWQVNKAFDWRGVESDLKDMQLAGINWVRIQLSGNEEYDNKLISLLSSYKIRPIIVIIGEPAKSTGWFLSRTQHRNAVQKIVSRYKETVFHYEVGNEPNTSEFWNIDTTEFSDDKKYQQSVADYIERLKDTATAVRSSNPKAFVLLGGLSANNLERWMNEFQRLEGYKYIDILSYHPYAENPMGVVEKIRTLKTEMAKVPDFARKPIWVTEVGFTTDKDSTSVAKVTDEKTKAEYLVQIYLELRNNNGIYGPIFWHTFVENASNKPGFGLVMKDTTTMKATYLTAFEGIKSLR